MKVKGVRQGAQIKMPGQGCGKVASLVHSCARINRRRKAEAHFYLMPGFILCRLYRVLSMSCAEEIEKKKEKGEKKKSKQLSTTTKHSVAEQHQHQNQQNQNRDHPPARNLPKAEGPVSSGRVISGRISALPTVSSI